jgi:predicted oxidoreductase
MSLIASKGNHMNRPSALAARGFHTSPLAYGGTGLGGPGGEHTLDAEDYATTEAAVAAALDAGIALFDHANIYRDGRAELAFAEVLRRRPGLRDEITIQSKVGIYLNRQGLRTQYDSSGGAIVRETEAILRRLGIERLDILLVHRPDPLATPDEIAEAFVRLHESGKVRAFGVSNHSAVQMRALARVCPFDLVVNQLQMSLRHSDFVENQILSNQQARSAIGWPDGTLEYCEANNVQIQAWGPLASGLFTGNAPADAGAEVAATTAIVGALAKELSTTPESVVLGWLMRHPARIQPIIGTTRPDRMQWFQLFVAARGADLP